MNTKELFNEIKFVVEYFVRNKIEAYESVESACKEIMLNLIVSGYLVMGYLKDEYTSLYTIYLECGLFIKFTSNFIIVRSIHNDVVPYAIEIELVRD